MKSNIYTISNIFSKFRKALIDKQILSECGIISVVCVNFYLKFFYHTLWLEKEQLENLSMIKTKLGIIGGSGLYQFPQLQNAEWINVQSALGEVSDDLLLER